MNKTTPTAKDTPGTQRIKEKRIRTARSCFEELALRLSDVKYVLAEAQIEFIKEASHDDERIERIHNYLSDAMLAFEALQFSDVAERRPK